MKSTAGVPETAQRFCIAAHHAAEAAAWGRKNTYELTDLGSWLLVSFKFVKSQEFVLH